MIVNKLNLDCTQCQKVFELSIAILRRSVADRLINFMVGKVVSELEIVGREDDFLELIACSYLNIGKTIVRVLIIGNTEWWQVL